MVLVFDVLLADELDFDLPRFESQGHQSLELALQAACASVGIELLEYGTLQVIRCGNKAKIQLRSRGWVTLSRRSAARPS